MWRQKKWWFGLFLAKFHPANGMTPKMLENCGEQVYITIGFNIDNVIFQWELSLQQAKVC